MNRYFAVILLIPLLAVSGFPRNKHPKRQVAPPGIDTGYVAALATANRFLYAWQTGDLETGMVLLSDRARRAQTADKIEQFFSGTSGRAFEVTHGEGDRGRYAFPVELITSEAGRVHRRFSKILVVSTGKNDWAIDKLP